MTSFPLSDREFYEINKLSIENLKSKISWHQDFPKKGVLFQDFSPMLSEPDNLKDLIELFAKRFEKDSIEIVCGLESRGFILGAPLALRLNAGFVPIRKQNKLPGPTWKANYEKEYGEDAFEISQSALKPNQRVLLIDDLIATGGSIAAALKLVRQAQAKPIAFACVLAVSELNGFSKIDIPCFQLIPSS